MAESSILNLRRVAISRTKPTPSVLSPTIVSLSNFRVLTAPAWRARAVRSSASFEASILNGMVTFNPRKPASRSPRANSSKPSIGAISFS